MKTLANMIGSALFPPNCILCRAPGDWICKKCQNTYLSRSPPECFWCRRFSNSYQTHTHCQKFTPISQMVVCWRYGPLARKIMSTFKYQMRYSIAEKLIEIAPIVIEQALSENTILIPTPTTKKRMSNRGFNQSKILCDEMARKYAIPSVDLLSKNSLESHQTGSDRSERTKLRRSAFIIRDSDQDISSSDAVLVDDICTTGTTLQRCAEVLANKGCGHISAFVLFRGNPVYRKRNQHSLNSASGTRGA